MRPTRRGYAALGIVALTVAMAVVGGTRALGAITGPVLVAVLAGAVQVARAGTPTVERTPPRRGFPGETRTVTLSVEGSGVASISERLPDGLAGDVAVERSLPTSVTYEVTYRQRGIHEIGPTVLVVRDSLGLVETRREVDVRSEVLVYPEVYSVGDPGAALRALGPEGDDRTEFDRIREYVPGDSLRNVNWKASAKHDDLLVTEFADPRDESAVSLAGACAPGHADEMAAAVATALVAAQRDGLTVELALPDGRLPGGYGESHRKHALELLARTAGGEIPEGWEDADVRVWADEDRTTISIDRAVHDIEEFTSSRENPLRSGVST